MIEEGKYKWHEDHVVEIATGKRYALFCPWEAGSIEGAIPAFLIISQEQRLANWSGVKLTDPHRGGNVEDWERKVQIDKENREAEKKAKNAKGRDLMKEKHPGERYNRKTKTWEKITVEVT